MCILTVLAATKQHYSDRLLVSQYLCLLCVLFYLSANIALDQLCILFRLNHKNKAHIKDAGIQDFNCLLCVTLMVNNYIIMLHKYLMKLPTHSRAPLHTLHMHWNPSFYSVLLEGTFCRWHCAVQNFLH